MRRSAKPDIHLLPRSVGMAAVGKVETRNRCLELKRCAAFQRTGGLDGDEPHLGGLRKRTDGRRVQGLMIEAGQPFAERRGGFQFRDGDDSIGKQNLHLRPGDEPDGNAAEAP